MTPAQFDEHLVHFEMTQTGAMLFLKVSRRTICRYSSGESEIPRAVELVLKVARKLEMSLTDFAKLAGLSS